MSIEAMKLALDALESRCGTNADERLPGGAITALRAALAQQPATPEPVWFHKHWGDDDDIFYRPDDKIPSGSTPLYTRPSPSVPDDSKRLDYLQDRGATIDLIAGVTTFYPMRFRVGGLDSSANIDVRAAIDAAMLAAKKRSA